MLLSRVLLAGCFAVLAGCGTNREQPNSVAHLAVDATEPAPAGVSVDNPQYQSWSKFAVGTVTVLRATSETEGVEGKTVTTTTTRLLELSPEHVKLESQIRSRRYDGHEESNPPSTVRIPARLVLPAGVKPADTAKADEQGEEVVTLAGRKYAARWHRGKDRNEGGEVTITTWTSPEVPGNLLKSVSRTSGVRKLVTIELVEVKLPAATP